MTSVVAVTNTVAFVFPDNAAQPTLPEMVRFVKKLKGNQDEMDTAYKNAEERTVFIKYKSEQAMRDALAHNEPKQKFIYANGSKVEVCMSVAGSNIQYVRVFDLPPEVPDGVLAAELQKFGKIKRCVREKFPPEYELDLFTGVRGVYMDIEKEIPPVLSFLNRRGRIFYRGNKLICFACGEEGHLKKSCGKRKVMQTRNTAADKADEARSTSFAAIVTGPSSSRKLTTSNENGDQMEQDEQEEEENRSAVSKTDQPKTNKAEMKRQRSIDSDTSNNGTKKVNVKDSNESDSSSISMSSDICPYTQRPYRLLDFSHIEDPEERRAAIEEDKRKINAHYQALIELNKM